MDRMGVRDRLLLPKNGILFLLILIVGVIFFWDIVTLNAQTNDPVISSVTITPDDDAGTGGTQVNPVPNNTVAVTATIEVTDPNGANDVNGVSVVVYKPDGITLHVPSGSATLSSASGNTATYTYSFNMNYYDAAATGSSYYKVVAVATDASSATGDNTNSPGKFNYTESVALSLNTALIDFGALDPGQTSTPFTVTGTNLGNVILDLSLSGTSLTSGSQNIGINRVDYDDNSGFTSPLTLSTTTQTGNYALSQGVGSSKGFYFRLRVPSAAEQYIPTGTYAGTVNISALRSSLNPTPPGVASISPTSGTQGQTLSVVINGSNFSGVTPLNFGSGITVNSFTVNSSTKITSGITIGALAKVGVRDISVTASGGTGTLGNAFTVIAQPPPTVTSVNPASGVRGQTLSVVISGSNFLGATTVTFSGSGITVNNFVVGSSTQITSNITIAGNAQKTFRDVSVTTASGTGTISAAFEVVQGPSTPTVTAAMPSSGYQGQALSVTITGTDFTGATAVSFGTEITVNSYTVNNASQISASITIAGGAAIGTRNVSVTTALGTGTLTGGFTVTAAPTAPTVTAISPNSGTQGQIISVTITGTDFTGATTVNFGAGITVNSFTVNSATQITANVTIAGAATVGARNVSVTTSLGTGTLTSGFTVTAVAVAPTVTSVSPTSGAQGASLSVVITGTEFSGASAVSFGPGITVNSFIINSGTQITASITIAGGASIGPRDVSVTNPTGTGALSGGFTVVAQPAPTVTAVSPTSGARGQTLAVIITGTNFTGATEVTFSGSGITVNSFTVDSATKVTANITIAGNAQKQLRDVSVTTPSGTGTLSAAFNVVQAPGAPTIISLSPATGTQGATLSVVITGTDFTGATVVNFGAGITVNSFTVNNASQISAGITIAGAAATGTRDVSVTTALGVGTLSSGFTVTVAIPAPTVTAVSPTSGDQGATLSVTITGTSFTGATSVGFGAGITVNIYTVDSATQITANISIAGTASAGTRDVSVMTASGTGTLSSGFTVNAATPAPTVTTVSPNTAAQGATLSVVITGTNFTGATAVSFGTGITVNSFTVDSATQISASVTIGGAAATGARDVTVTTAAGTGTLTGGFTVTTASGAPTVTSISPTSGTQGQILAITITGTDFTGAMAVGFGADVTVNSYTVDSATQIMANITVGASSATGTRDVTVTTAFGTGTLTAGFTVFLGPPTVTAVSPNSAFQGQTLSVIITGTNFTGATSVSFGAGVTVTGYTVDSATQITANVTIDVSATAGTRDVSVATSSGTGTTTAGFTVNAAEVPTVASVSPNSGTRNQTLNITIAGTNFIAGATVSFSGDGRITVNSVTVNSSTQITANITIANNAQKSARDVSVTTAAGTGTLNSGFTVN